MISSEPPASPPAADSGLRVDDAVLDTIDDLAANHPHYLDDLRVWRAVLTSGFKAPSTANARLEAVSRQLIAAADYRHLIGPCRHRWSVCVDHEARLVHLDPAHVWPTVTLFTTVLAAAMVTHGAIDENAPEPWQRHTDAYLFVTDHASALAMGACGLHTGAVRDFPDRLRTPARLAVVATRATALARTLLAAFTTPALTGTPSSETTPYIEHG